MNTPYHLLLQSVQDYVILMLDVNGKIVYTNAAIEPILGYTPSEVCYQPLYHLLKGAAPNPEMEELKQERHEMAGWCRHKNGSPRWVSAITTPVYDEQNKLTGYSCIIRDLTEEKQKEQELRETVERNRLLVEVVKDYANFMLDPNRIISSWNEGARRFKGYEAHEIIGQHFSVFYTPEDKEDRKPERELKIAIATGKYEEEGWRVRKDGSLFWANVLITAVFNRERRLLGFTKVTRDLSERKKAELELRESEERYRLLAHSLREANIELTAANKELEQYTSIVSHDLQEPLRTIHSFLQLIEAKLPEQAPAEIKTYVGKCINASIRMRELIRNLLQYAQLGKGEIEVNDIDVNDMLNEVLQNLKNSIEAADAHVVLNNEISTIRGDRVQLVQLIQNLVANALKFKTDKKPEIVIQGIEQQGAVRFSVADNGIGIAPENREKIFEIFKRVHSTKEYPGTGIGLSICKRIVERHKGTMWIESELGQGSKFSFSLNTEALAEV